MKALWLADSDDFANFLEEEILAGRNPKTPEEWDEFFTRFRERMGDKVKLIQIVSDDMTAGDIAAQFSLNRSRCN